MMAYDKTFQRILVKGRIAKDIDFKIQTNGTAIATFGIVVNEGNDNDFIPVVAWGNKARLIADSVEVGDLIEFEGKIRSSTYDSPEKGKVFSLKLQVSNDSDNLKAILQFEKKKQQTTNNDGQKESN